MKIHYYVKSSVRINEPYYCIVRKVTWTCGDSTHEIMPMRYKDTLDAIDVCEFLNNMEAKEAHE